MNTPYNNIGIDKALNYLQAYKDTGNVDDLAMVETFLADLYQVQKETKAWLSSPTGRLNVSQPEPMHHLPKGEFIWDPDHMETLRNDPTAGQPALRAAPMGLFPTMESLQQVIDLANSQLPVQTPNAMLSLLMIYHNSLLHQVQCCKP